MATTNCAFGGDADMYGLGIRIGYYLQWVGVLLAAWICPREVPSIRLANAFFVAATFLALLTQVPPPHRDGGGGGAGLKTVEIYITLLFTFGSSLSLLPVLLWRILTRCSPRCDPSRFPKAKPPSAVFVVLNSILNIAVAAFQVWFWAKRVDEREDRTCPRYAFLFKRVRLDMWPLRILNLVLSALLGVLLLVFLLIMPWSKTLTKTLRIKDDRPKASVIRFYRNYNTLTSLFVASTIIAATELTIRWNEISGVNGINSAGQCIPLVIGVGSFLRILYMGFKTHRGIQEEEDDDIAPWHHAPVYAAPLEPGWTDRRPDNSIGMV